MSLDLNVSFDQAKIDALSRGLVAMPRQLQFARARALRKTGGWVRNEVKKLAAKQLRIPQKSIADRFYLTRIKPTDDVAKLWIGTWNVSPYALGKPVQSGFGVRVNKRSYRGAFLGKVYNAQEKIWIRKRSKHYDPELYPVVRKRSAGAGVPPELRHRFPVVRAAIPIDAALDLVIKRNWQEIETRFRKTLVQEINYEVNVRGKK